MSEESLRSATPAVREVVLTRFRLFQKRPPSISIKSEDADETKIPIRRQRVDVYSNNFVLIVNEVKFELGAKILLCRSLEDEYEVYVVRLRDLWSTTPIRPKHSIRLIDSVAITPQMFEISNNRGQLILEPFNLITSTSLASALYCKRKSVLQNRFRGSGTNRTMLIGCIVHKVFQVAISRTDSKPTVEVLSNYCRDVVLRDYGVELILNDIDSSSMDDDLRPYLKNISNWLLKYASSPVGAQQSLGIDETYSQIQRVVDVEREYRSSKYGMKGRIDVALQFQGSSNVVPLELKTGKSGAQIEHRAQLVAYSLMLSDDNRETPEPVPGILLYLRDNTMRPIRSSDTDISGFLTLRNEMAGWFSEFDIEELPTYELHNLMNRTTEHLTEVELEYARRWIKWTLMEWETNFRDMTSPTTSQNQTSNNTNRNDSYYSNGLTLQNISTLMANTDEGRRLRSLLIERQPPKFTPEIKLPESVEEFLTDLDTPQRAAIDHCISAEDYAIIQGLPGAGKTTMIAALVASLVKMRKSVLVSAHTHSAVDNVMMKLKGLVPDFQILRLGNASSLHPDVLQYGLDARIEKISGMSRLDLTQKMKHLQRALFFIVVGATCLMCSSHSLFAKRRFDYCIIDEASLALESVALGPLFASEKFIFVGDTKQLCPLVVNKDAAQQGMSVSLMERLLKQERVSQESKSCEAVSLTWQYRMNREICDLASSLFYNSKLVCANSSIESATLKCENIQDENIPIHISNVLLSSDLSHSVMFIDLQSEAPTFQSKTDPITKSKYNQGEASVINKLVKSLMNNNVHHSGIGVITPFRAQAECLLKVISANHTENEHPEVSTIDRYQGRDKSVIIISLTYGHNEILSNDTTSHLADERRINVAFTRAKHKLILVGRKSSLVSNNFLAKIISQIPTQLSYT
ncbi:hypothetical protein M3Y94_00105000 [Aphelenchoides besseyi]|nr:hypothetical protein M3Y94_00105000 [Aphelenchoides besseyi]